MGRKNRNVRTRNLPRAAQRQPKGQRTPSALPAHNPMYALKGSPVGSMGSRPRSGPQPRFTAGHLTSRQQGGISFVMKGSGVRVPASALLIEGVKDLATHSQRTDSVLDALASVYAQGKIELEELERRIDLHLRQQDEGGWHAPDLVVFSELMKQRYTGPIRDLAT